MIFFYNNPISNKSNFVMFSSFKNFEYENLSISELYPRKSNFFVSETNYFQWCFDIPLLPISCLNVFSSPPIVSSAWKQIEMKAVKVLSKKVVMDKNPLLFALCIEYVFWKYLLSWNFGKNVFVRVSILLVFAADLLVGLYTSCKFTIRNLNSNTTGKT